MNILDKLKAMESSFEAFFTHASSLADDFKEMKHLLTVASNVADVIAPTAIAQALDIAEHVVGAVGDALSTPTASAPAVQPEDTTPQTIGS